MKRFKFIAAMLAAGALVACNERMEAPDADGTPYEGETGYINISLNLPTTSGASTRANDVFDDGLEEEYNVNEAIIALFYGKDEATAKCEVAFKLSSVDFQLEKDTDNITSFYASGVRMIPDPDEGESVYALAILNPTSNFTIKGTATEGEDKGDVALTTTLSIDGGTNIFTGDLDNLNTAVTFTEAAGLSTIASTENGGSFLMTNAPIASDASFQTSAPEGFAVTTLAKINVYSSKDKSIAEGAAAANPIYVERAVAKVTLDVDGTDKTLTVTDEAYKGATVKFDGWVLQNTNKKYYPVRKVTDESIADWEDWKGYWNGVSGEYNRFFGQAINPYRTYWGIDPNYNSVLTTTLSENFNIITTVADGDWNDVGSRDYCAENTTTAKTMQEDQLTGVLLKAYFDPDGNGTGGNFFMLNNTSAIYKEDGDKGFLAWAEAVLANTTDAKLDEGESLSLKADQTEGMIITNAAGVKSLLQVTKTAEPTSGYPEELSDNQANAILVAAGSNIKFYKDGVTYYYSAVIRHFDDTQTPITNTTIDDLDDYDEGKHLGRYGVVRNNWYELTITSVSGPGEPVIPEIPKFPPDKLNSYINCEINVLAWAKRTQNVDL